MRENQKLIDDLMSLGGSMLGNLLGARHEMGAQARQRMEGLSRRLNLVTREEFDSAFAMLARARAIQDELLERLESIEAKLNLSSKASRVKAKKSRLPSVKKGNQRRKRG